MGQKVYLVGIILYTFLSFIVQALTEIKWIDAFTVFMLSGIFYQILDWKYANTEGEQKADE